MALSAARTDLTVSVVGEDETQQAIEQANANMRQLEARLKSLQAAGRGQAEVAKTQSGALDTVNGKMKGLAGMAEGAVEGVDKVKGAFEKVVGVVGFVGPAIAGVVAGVMELVDSFGGASAEVARLTSELEASKKRSDEFSVSMKTLKASVDAAMVSTTALSGSTSALRSRLAQLRGDVLGAEFERRNAEVLKVQQEIESTEERMLKVREAQTKASQMEAEARAALKRGVEEEAALRQQVERDQMDRKLGLNQSDMEAVQLRQQLLQATINENKAARDALATAQLRDASLEKQVESLVEQRNLLQQIAKETETAIFAMPEVEAPKPAKPSGGQSAEARRKAELDRAEREAQAIIDALQMQLGAMYEEGLEELELDQELAAEARARDERRRKELEEARKASEEAMKLQQELAEKARFDMTDPVYAFADALRGSLIPELDAFTGVMDKVMAQFDAFREGQVSLTQAIAAGATEIVASAARSIGGVKAEAAVRAIYETAMGFATLGNPVISAGHFTAAGLLAGVATGVISTGGGAAKSASAGGLGKPATSTGMAMGSSGGGGGGSVTNVYNLNAGVVDGQSTTRAFRRAEVQSRNTGFAMAGGW